MMNLHVAGKTVWILISWLLKKPADLSGSTLFSIEFISRFILLLKDVCILFKDI